jgi:hypothetical protein
MGKASSRRRHPLPESKLAFEEVMNLFGGYTGEAFIGGQDPKNMELASALTRKGHERLKKNYGDDLPTHMSLPEIQSLRWTSELTGKEEAVTPQDFKKMVKRRLMQTSAASGKTWASTDFLEGLTYGTEGGGAVRDKLEGLKTSALDIALQGSDLRAQGLALAQGDISSPLAQDAMQYYNQQFGSALAGTGIARSGAAALQNTVGGLRTIQSLGERQVSMGSGLARGGYTGAAGIDPYLGGGYGIARGDANFQRDLGAAMWAHDAHQAHRARRLARPTNQNKNALLESATGLGTTLVGGLIGGLI